MHRSRILSGLIVAAAALGTASVTAGFAAAADTVRSCVGNRPLGDTGMWYGDLSVRNIRCWRGHRLLRSADYDGDMRIAGWRCSLIGTSDGGIFRCTRGDRAIRFSAGG